MCNVANKLALLCAIFMVSCGDSDPDRAAAQALADRAEEAMEKGNAELALALMDSVDLQYPSQVEVRRAVTALRPKAIQSSTISRIAKVDSMICNYQLELESVAGNFKHIDGDGLEGYYICKDAYVPEFTNTTGVEARVNDADFNFYIVVNNTGKSIGLNQISLFTPESDCTSQAIPASSARKMVLEGSEMATFLPEEVDDLGKWTFDNPNIKGVMLYGDKGNQKIVLKDAQAQSFGKAWRYAFLKKSLKSALLLREKLDRQLQIARDQEANHQIEQNVEL